MTKLEELKKAIQVACPDLMELKFGCEVTSGNIEGKLKLFGCGISGYLFQQPAAHDELSSRHSTYELKIEDCNIIGSPINLSHVLRAIKGKHIGIQSNGCFINLMPGDPIGKYELSQWYYRWDEQYHTYEWNLEEDNLDHQSEETIDFIYGLLTNH